MIHSVSNNLAHYQITGFHSTSDPAADETNDKSVKDNFSDTVTSNSTDSFTKEQIDQIQELKSRDREVRQHEQSHLSAAGGLATSGASFSYQTGPDGKRYAIGGEVKIDTSAVPGDPQATLRKADIIRRAALAPASPSPQDYKVAAKAAQMAMKASAELVKEKQIDDTNSQSNNSNTVSIDLQI